MNRRVKTTVIVVIVLIGLLVGADYGLAAAAEYQVSKRMRSELNLAADPSVDIHGFPFITQALAGDYSDISVDAIGVPVQNKLRDLEVDADLHHVRVPLSNLLSGNVQSLKVDEVDGQVKIKATDVGRMLNIPDLAITPVSLDTILGAGADQAQQQKDQNNPNNQSSQSGQQERTVSGTELTGTVLFAGQQTKVSVYGILSIVNGGIQVKPEKLDLSNNFISGALSSVISQEVLGMFAVTLSPSELPLPFTVQATGVQVENGALIVQGTAHNVVVNSGSSGSNQ